MSTQAVSNLPIFQPVFTRLQKTSGNDNKAGKHLAAFIVNLSGTPNAGGAEDVSRSESPSLQLQEFWWQRKAGLDQLGKALQSGNADSAQQAYDALVALGQNRPLRNLGPFQRTDRAQYFDASQNPMNGPNEKAK